jgi:hypothetical protein
MPESLRATHPNLEKFWPFLQLLRNESARGQVLISAGFLEEQLKDVLLGFMVDNPEPAIWSKGRMPHWALSVRASRRVTPWD